MRIFVAGATGAIGKQLVPRLVAAGHEVVGTTRSESKSHELYDFGATPALAGELGAKRPMRVPRFVGRVAAGEAGVMAMTELRGVSNAKAKRKLGWAPAHASWRAGFVAA
jgi:NAD(P)-dependent dehydrogenase (short-subunit alcohol dehydrogenase family)